MFLWFLFVSTKKYSPAWFSVIYLDIASHAVQASLKLTFPPPPGWPWTLSYSHCPHLERTGTTGMCHQPGWSHTAKLPYVTYSRTIIIKWQGYCQNSLVLPIFRIDVENTKNDNKLSQEREITSGLKKNVCMCVSGGMMRLILRTLVRSTKRYQMI